MSGAMTIEAAPAPAPGHCTFTGALTPCWATTLVPLIASVAVWASALSVRGFTSRARLGALPPVGKNASRISAARWKSCSVASDSLRVRFGLGLQVQVLPLRLTSGSRLVEKNRSITPPGANILAKSASGASRSVLANG